MNKNLTEQAVKRLACMQCVSLGVPVQSDVQIKQNATHKINVLIFMFLEVVELMHSDKIKDANQMKFYT